MQLYPLTIWCAQSLNLVQLFCDPMDCSLLASSVHGLFQARVLEWAVIAFSEVWLVQVNATQINGKKLQIYKFRCQLLKFHCKLLVELHVRLLATSAIGILYILWILIPYQIRDLKRFPPPCRLPFHFVDCFLWCTAMFKFDVVPFVYFCFCYLSFSCHTPEITAIQCHEDCPPCSRIV